VLFCCWPGSAASTANGSGGRFTALSWGVRAGGAALTGCWAVGRRVLVSIAQPFPFRKRGPRAAIPTPRGAGFCHCQSNAMAAPELKSLRWARYPMFLVKLFIAIHGRLNEPLVPVFSDFEPGYKQRPQTK